MTPDRARGAAAVPARAARGWAAELRPTLALALPLMLGQLTSMGMNVADVLLAGHVNARVLGTVAVATAIYNISNMASAGVNAAIVPSVAQLDGAGQRAQVGPLFRQALAIAAGLGVLLMGLVYFAGPAFATLLGFPDDLTAETGEFLRAIAPAAPAVSLFYCCRGLSEGLSMTRPTPAFALLGLLVLAGLGYVLMYSPFGNPPLGARGCALATVVTAWAEVAGFALWIGFSPGYRGLGWRGGDTLPRLSAMLGLLRIGLPMAVSMLLETGLFSAAGLAIGRFGEVAAASHQVALNVAATSFMVPLGISIATSVRVGHAVGRRDPVAVRRAGFTGMALALAAQGVSGGLMLLAPEAIGGIFSGDAAVISGSTLLLRIAGVFQLPDGLQVSAMGALRGLKDTRVPMLITAVAYWLVGFPLALVLAFGLGWQAPGMWCGLIAGLTVAAALLTGRFASLSRRLAAG